MTSPRVPVSKGALVQRIRRRLAPLGRDLRAIHAGSQPAQSWIVVEGDEILESNVDIEELGRRLEALRSFEEVEP